LGNFVFLPSLFAFLHASLRCWGGSGGGGNDNKKQMLFLVDERRTMKTPVPDDVHCVSLVGWSQCCACTADAFARLSHCYCSLQQLCSSHAFRIPFVPRQCRRSSAMYRFAFRYTTSRSHKPSTDVLTGDAGGVGGSDWWLGWRVVGANVGPDHSSPLFQACCN
jgi:hypothetical protein